MACGRKVESRFFVEGACEACAPLIESAVLDLGPVRSAHWDISNSILVVAYDTTRVSVDALQAAVAEKGFNTQYYPANDASRAQLPACCKEAISTKLKVPDYHGIPSTPK